MPEGITLAGTAAACVVAFYTCGCDSLICSQINSESRCLGDNTCCSYNCCIPEGNEFTIEGKKILLQTHRQCKLL
jgi:hypothetical protein